MPFCARCDRPIKGKPRKVDNMSPSGPGSTITLCPEPCRPQVRPPTAPSGLGARPSYRADGTRI
ncbi:hypothetical protein AB0M11_08040 [Streptomyces sp. NPDC051987]|uniref:hypothetical protein n=1 Tax=Streptomyces sp. NPDC051987 TaxID=3155808 RepID=UPI00341EC1D2